MRIRVLRNGDAVARAVADDVETAVADKPELVLGLPTGRTPVAAYAELVRRVEQGRLDLTRVTTFNLDEFLGLPPRDPSSYRTFMETHLFAAARPRRVHFLDGSAADPDAECRRYERALARAGGMDLLLLGIGSNGHIGFNEPGAALAARTHRARLLPGTRRANAGLFDGDVRRVPREALSMGVGTILSARRIVLVATGAGKAAVIRATLEGPLTTRVPASFLQLHPAVTVLLDRPAAGRL